MNPLLVGDRYSVSPPHRYDRYEADLKVAADNTLNLTEPIADLDTPAAGPQQVVDA